MVLCFFALIASTLALVWVCDQVVGCRKTSALLKAATTVQGAGPWTHRRDHDDDGHRPRHRPPPGFRTSDLLVSVEIDGSPLSHLHTSYFIAPFIICMGLEGAGV
jgi:hypothetical protein